MSRLIKKRVRIENGLIAAIARKGLGATTVQDIAREAGVSPGLLYRYWESRDALAAAVYRKHVALFRRRLSELVIGERDVAGRLRAVVDGMLRYVDEEPVLMRFLLRGVDDLPAGATHGAILGTIVRPILRDGMTTDTVGKLNVEPVLHILVGVMLAPVMGVLWGRLAAPASQYAGSVFDALRGTLLTGVGHAFSDDLTR